MAALAGIADILESVETDLPDSVLQRFLDAAEVDVRLALTADERKSLPTQLWHGRLVLDPGSTYTLRLPTTIEGFAFGWFGGTVLVDGVEMPFTASTDELAMGASQTGTLEIDTVTGLVDTGITFTLTGTSLELDATLATVRLTIDRISGQPTLSRFPTVELAVLDLVALAVANRGLRREETGQYEVESRDYHQERANVLTRMVYTAGTSILA